MVVSVEQKKEEQKIYSFETISRFLQDKRLYYVATHSGVSYPVLTRLKNRAGTNYMTSTLIAISSYMENYMKIAQSVNNQEVKNV